MTRPVTRSTVRVRVRDARADDVVAIVTLLAQLNLSGERREQSPTDAVYAAAFAAIAADPRQQLLVVVEDSDGVDDSDGVVRGTATLIVIPNLSHGGAPVAQLESVVVDRHARGRGWGGQLVEECLRRATAAGCFRAQLTSRSERHDAHRFWVGCGFVHTHAGFKRGLPG